MTYVKQVWTDTVTPVDKAHMDHIEDGIVAAVPADVVAAAATRVVASFLAAPDTQPAFKITGDGKIQWGLGGSTAPDISLSRAAVGQLQIGASGAAGSIRSWGAAGSDNSFMSLVTGDSQFRFIARADGMHLWGPGNAAADIALFRVAANVLQLGTGASSYAALRVQRAAATDAALQSNVAGDTVMRWQSDASGKHEWGPGGSTAVDTSLYRSAASTLKTDGNLIVGGKITGADWTLICTQILGGTQANFDTNTLLGGNIPSTFTHLMIVIQANSTIAFDNLYLRVNNDGGANYDAQWLSVSGTAVSGAQDIAADHIHICAMPSVITAGPFASAKILISNYKGTAFWKSIQSEANRKDTSGAGNANLGLRAGTWLSTAAVTRLTLYPASGSFAAGSVFSLYGLS
jgi:hypothetical protein